LLNRASLWVEPNQFERDLVETQQILGLTGRKYFRPGCGYYSHRLLDQVERHDYTMVLGNIYPLDPQIPWVSFLRTYIETQVKPGSIIILHDGPGRVQRTISTLNHVVPKLRGQGYRFQTLDEMEVIQASY
jgi:peptidoglycan/xylan/chitin deacetylase (PgdA/CDA1 family)